MTNVEAVSLLEALVIANGGAFKLSVTSSWIGRIRPGYWVLRYVSCIGLRGSAKGGRNYFLMKEKFAVINYILILDKC